MLMIALRFLFSFRGKRDGSNKIRFSANIRVQPSLGLL